MDPFNVDMELLRRIGEMRPAVEELDEHDPSSTDSLLKAIDRVRERVDGENVGLLKLLALMVWGVSSAEESQRTSTSKMADGLKAAVGAAEQAFFSEGEAESGILIDQAGGNLLLSLDLNPDSWIGWTPPGAEFEDDSPSAAETGGRTTVDDVAAFMVGMDPEDRGATMVLKELLENFGDPAVHPDGVTDIVATMLEALEAVTTPLRTKKSVRREAVERVGELLEQTAIILEEMETPEVGQEKMETPEAGQEEARTPEAGQDEDSDFGMDEPLAEEIQLPEARAEVETEVEAESSQPTMDIFPSSEPIPEGIDPDLALDFVTEGFEYLEQAEEALLILEKDPKDKEAVNVVFRAFHTIKGVSGFMELHRISNLAHHAETLLSKVREDELRYTGVVADISLRGLDVLKTLLQSIRDGIRDGVLRLPPDYGPLFTILADPKLHMKIETGTMPGMVPTAPVDDLKTEDEGDHEEEGGKRQSSETAESSVRVRTGRLDQLVNMVGELVIAHSMLAQDKAILVDRGNLSRQVDHSAKLLRELQDLSTSLRMVPLKPAFLKVTRVVRDLSKKMGKPVDLITDGEDTEIDRTMVDVLGDPLVHMMRNSLDHGLETPDERVAAGKPKRGQLRLSAYQAGGNVIIEIADDGRGLNRERIVAKAIEKGLLDSERGMTDSEIYNLIFAPGFSTAAKVTEVSGRGVGMDVVRRNVESLRGRVSIDSNPGKGSIFSIHLPLTLAITDGMVTRIGSHRYIIPTVKIQMTLRPEAEALSTVAERGEMVLLQGDLLPIIRLHRMWGIPDAIENLTDGLLVIVGEGRGRAALLVDELVTQQQFVVKPLLGVVAKTQGVAGGAIMGNGDVGLILDPEGIIARSRGINHSTAA